MKSNRLTNILLVAVLAVLLSGRLPAASPTPVQPAAAAPAAPRGYIPQAGMISGYVSVSAAAFHPTIGGQDYWNDGSQLAGGSPTNNSWVAEISLPDGATVDSIECLMWDFYPTANGEVDLMRGDIGGGGPTHVFVMGSVFSNDSTSAWTLYYTTNISYAQVNNSLNTYYIYLDLPYGDINNHINFSGVWIHYYYDAIYLPTVSK